MVFQPKTGIDTGSHHPALNAIGSCDLSYKALRELVKEDTNAIGKREGKGNGAE
jgi:hypothetical protein